MRKSETIRQLNLALDMRELMLASCITERDTARADLAIAEDALEAERQWRLTSLPALLAAEERAVKAEARVAELEAVVARDLTQFPELSRSTAKRHAALAAAYHESKERP